MVDKTNGVLTSTIIVFEQRNVPVGLCVDVLRGNHTAAVASVIAETRSYQN